jgi:hypothetical protein
MLSATTHSGMVNPSAVVVQPAARLACDWTLSSRQSITYWRRQSQISEKMESCTIPISGLPQRKGGLHSATGRRNARHSLLVINRSAARSNFKLCFDDDAWRFLNRHFSLPARCNRISKGARDLSIPFQLGHQAPK